MILKLDRSDLEVLQYDYRERYLELEGIGREIFARGLSTIRSIAGDRWPVLEAEVIREVVVVLLEYT